MKITAINLNGTYHPTFVRKRKEVWYPPMVKINEVSHKGDTFKRKLKPEDVAEMIL